MRISLLEEVEHRFATKGSWVLKCKGVPPSGNVTKRMHWTRYSRLLQDWYQIIRAADGFLDVSRPEGKRFVTIVRYSARKLDWDNLMFSVKPVVDNLKPAKKESGIYKTGLKAGQGWSRERIGHGLILEDDESVLDLKVVNGALPKRTKPYTLIIISDYPIVNR